jgi:hypothetical protein
MRLLSLPNDLWGRPWPMLYSSLFRRHFGESSAIALDVVAWLRYRPATQNLKGPYLPYVSLLVADDLGLKEKE